MTAELQAAALLLLSMWVRQECCWQYLPEGRSTGYAVFTPITHVTYARAVAASTMCDSS